MAAIAVADDGSRVMQASVPACDAVHAAAAGALSFDEYYETRETAAWVAQGGFARVALQLPDAMLGDAPAVVRALQAAVGADVLLFVLGDTSYGSCCVDEVSARHLGADAVVHYGRSCFSPATGLPVRYVFGRAPVDVAALAAAFDPADTAVWMLLFEERYGHAAPAAAEALRAAHGERCQIVVGEVAAEWPASGSPGVQPPLPPAAGEHTETAVGEQTEEQAETTTLVGGHAVALPPGTELRECGVLFLGEAGAHMTTVAMQCNESPMLAFSPRSGALEAQSLRVNRALQRRFYLVQRARDADIVGLVVGTLGVARFDATLARCRALAAREGKRTYTFVVGRLNPAKLANFAEVDVFCLVACPENSLLDSAEYHAPVVTPFELEIALGEREWTGEYSVDFRDLPLDAPVGARPGAGEADSDDDQPYFSLVSGGLRARSDVAGAVDAAGGGALIEYSSPAADFLQQREFRGLEQRPGEDAPAQLVQGHAGIARGYAESPDGPGESVGGDGFSSSVGGDGFSEGAPVGGDGFEPGYASEESDEQ